jgi:hypothetical protein
LKEKYFSARELGLINEFISFMPQCKTIYKNEKGEERKVVWVRLPKGCKTPLTVFSEDLEHYHTPTASLDGVVALVYYKDLQTDEHATVDSTAWLKWLGESYTMRDGSSPAKSGLDSYVASTLEARRKGGIQEMSGKEFDEQTGGDKAKWRPVTRKKKSL